MGKKKTKKKTRKVREVVGEASSIGETTQQQQSQPPRKRGRPRKIIEKTETEEKNQAEEGTVEDSDSKRVKTSEEEQKEVKGIGSSSSTSFGALKEGASDEPKSKEPPKGRGRRKSQPRKSSS